MCAPLANKKWDLPWSREIPKRKNCFRRQKRGVVEETSLKKYLKAKVFTKPALGMVLSGKLRGPLQ